MTRGTDMNENKQELISVVIPAFNEESCIADAAEKISGVLDKENFELVFVDDGSKDESWNKISELSSADRRIRGIKFSRNFGKEAAIFAGLAYAKGDCCIVMDCDLQHPPEKIPEMLGLWREGIFVVEGIKSDRGKESVKNKAGAGLFYKLLSKAVKKDMAGTSDFKLLDRKAVDVLLALREKNTFFRALSSWIGFPSARVEYEVAPRISGKTKWNLKSLTGYALTNLVSFSALPLKLISYLGWIVLIISIVLGAQSLIKKFTGQALEGFTTVILLQLFIGSILMIALGILGYYVAKIYEEVKSRPRYIVQEQTTEHQN